MSAKSPSRVFGPASRFPNFGSGQNLSRAAEHLQRRALQHLTWTVFSHSIILDPCISHHSRQVLVHVNMYCMRWWIPLFLLPFPKTSPLFLVLFLVSFALHSQPCMYCALILTGLFTTSSNWYGPASSIVAVNSANSSVAMTNTSLPRSSYGWFDFGYSGGNGFFSPIARPSSASNSALDAAETHDFYRLSIPWSESQVQIPKRFFVGVGKHGGMGVWVDLGSGISSVSSTTEALQTPSSPCTVSSTKHVEL